jgi:hypothetical protein
MPAHASSLIRDGVAITSIGSRLSGIHGHRARARGRLKTDDIKRRRVSPLLFSLDEHKLNLRRTEAIF